MTIPTPKPPHSVRHNQGVSVLKGSHETMRLRGPDGYYVWLQDGHVYDDAGKPIDPPAWMREDIKKMTPSMREVHAVDELGKKEEAPSPVFPIPQDTNNEAKMPAIPKAAAPAVERFPVLGDEGHLVEPNPGPFPEEFNDPDLLDEQKEEAMKEAEAASKTTDEAEPPAEADDLDSLNKADLVELAEKESVEISSGDTKAMIKNKILAQREEN